MFLFLTILSDDVLDSKENIFFNDEFVYSWKSID